MFALTGLGILLEFFEGAEEKKMVGAYIQYLGTV